MSGRPQSTDVGVTSERSVFRGSILGEEGSLPFRPDLRELLFVIRDLHLAERTRATLRDFMSAVPPLALRSPASVRVATFALALALSAGCRRAAPPSPSVSSADAAVASTDAA